MSKKITKQKEDNDGMKVLNIIRTSTKNKEKMYKKVTDDIHSIKETQKKVNQKFEKIDKRLDRVDVNMAGIKQELVSFEERMERVITNSANKLYTRIDPLLTELENARLDHEFSTQKDSEFEVRIEKLEKAAN